MKINFLGGPSSLKTTIASIIFSKLKKLGFTSEFITEQARLYISEIRYNAKNQGDVVLLDSDQLVIMQRQLKVETVVEYSVDGGSHLVCDSSPLNSLFYMSDQFRKDPQVRDLVKKTLESVDLVFYCEPFALEASGNDPNRVHSSEQSQMIDKKIFSVLKEECPDLVPKIKTLKGSSEDRATKVMNILLGI